MGGIMEERSVLFSLRLFLIQYLFCVLKDKLPLPLTRIHEHTAYTAQGYFLLAYVYVFVSLHI